jgi:hypothetical protein
MAFILYYVGLLLKRLELLPRLARLSHRHAKPWRFAANAPASFRMRQLPSILSQLKVNRTEQERKAECQSVAAYAPAHPKRTRRASLLPFTAVFYGVRIFGCKTAQFRATQRNTEMAETPSVGNGAQASENARKNSFLN